MAGTLACALLPHEWLSSVSSRLHRQPHGGMGRGHVTTFAGVGLVELVVIAGAIAVAACLQGAIGFGLGMLAAPVVALVDPSLLPGTIVIVGGVLTLLAVIRDRAAIDLRGAGWAVLGRVPGSVAGALLVATLPIEALAVVLSATVLIGVLLSVRGWRPRERPLTLATAGAASGLMGTATGIGGPPMALVWQGSSAARMRGTMSAFFLLGTLVSMIALYAVGEIGATTLRFSAVVLPAAVLGFSASGFINRHMSTDRVRRVALAASTLGAVLVILQALLS